jgi:hypothetical protein
MGQLQTLSSSAAIDDLDVRGPSSRYTREIGANCRLLIRSRQALSHTRRREDQGYSSPIFSAAMNASCGISTLPNCRIFFLPRFCASSSLRLRVA